MSSKSPTAKEALFARLGVVEIDGRIVSKSEAGTIAKPQAVQAPANRPQASQPVTKDRVKIVAAAVANDENCKGKAALAISMLADNDYAGLNGAALVKIIAMTPVAGQSSTSAADAARADMRAAIAENTGYSFEPSRASAVGSQRAAASVWDKAIANLPPAAA